jgi:hypothetical protein
MLQYFLSHSFATFSASQQSQLLARRPLEPPISKFLDALVGLPERLVNLVADGLLYELKKGVRQGLVNFHFSVSFLGRLVAVPMYAKPLLARMALEEIQLLELFCSPDYRDSFYANQWFLLMIRMGTPPDDVASNYYFDGILQQFQNLFFSNIVLNIWRNVAQKLALSTFNWLRKARDRNRTLTTNDKAKSAIPARRYRYEDIHHWARKDAIAIHLEMAMRDTSMIGLSGVSHFITPSLKSQAKDIYHPAVDIFIDLIHRETKARVMVHESETLSSLYDAYFDIMRRNDPEYATKVIRTIPLLATTFLQHGYTKKDPPGFCWETFGISLDKVLSGVVGGITDTPDEAPFVLLLCKTSFEVIKANYMTENNRMATSIDVSLRLLTSLLKFDIKPTILAYCKQVNTWFAQHTSDRWGNHYFVSLFNLAGSCRSALSMDLSDLAADLVKECLRLKVPSEAMSRCLSDLFYLTTPTFYQCAFILGLYCVGRLFPDAVMFEHLDLLMNYCSHNFQHDARIADLTNTVVWRLFARANADDRQRVVLLFYERLYRLPGAFRLPLLLRASEFSVSLRLPSFDDILDIEDTEHCLAKLTVAFAFGITGDMTIRAPVRDRVTNMIPEPQRSNRSVMERLSRMTMLCYVILRMNKKTLFVVYMLCNNDDKGASSRIAPFGATAMIEIPRNLHSN